MNSKTGQVTGTRESGVPAARTGRWKLLGRALVTLILAGCVLLALFVLQLDKSESVRRQGLSLLVCATLVFLLVAMVVVMSLTRSASLRALLRRLPIWILVRAASVSRGCRWVAAAGLVPILFLWILSYIYLVGYQDHRQRVEMYLDFSALRLEVFPPNYWLGRRSEMVRRDANGVYVRTQIVGLPSGRWNPGFSTDRLEWSYSPWFIRSLFPRLRKDADQSIRGRWYIVLPLYIPFFALGLIAVSGHLLPLVVYRLRRARSVCVQCEYDLTGNRSGVCPECGEPVPKKELDLSAQDADDS